MKQKLSVTIEENTIFKIKDLVTSGRYRNKSHVVEYAVNKLLEDSKND